MSTSLTFKTHGSVSHAPKKWGMHSLHKYISTKNKVRFRRIHSSVIYCSNKTKFAVEVPAYQERAHTRSEPAIPEIWAFKKSIIFFISFCKKNANLHQIAFNIWYKLKGILGAPCYQIWFKYKQNWQNHKQFQMKNDTSN